MVTNRVRELRENPMVGISEFARKARLSELTLMNTPNLSKKAILEKGFSVHPFPFCFFVAEGRDYFEAFVLQPIVLILPLPGTAPSSTSTASS